MKSIRFTLIIILFTAITLVTSCTTAIKNGPEKAVELYLSALVEKDGATLAGLSCADWEPNALMELDSLQAVEVKLTDLTCETNGAENEFTLVQCKGFLVATYNGEDQNIDLSLRRYLVQEFNSGFLVCGYK